MPLLVDFHYGDVTTAPGDGFAVIQDGIVLDRSRHKVTALRGHLERGMDGRVVGLCSSARENDLARFATEKRRQSLMRQVGCFLYFGSETMRARWITVLRRQKRHHLVQHRG